MQRPREQRSKSTQESTRKANWIKALLALGLDYEIVILEEVASRDVLADAERFWIAYGRASGWPLANHTDGGEGKVGFKTSDATKAKIAMSNRGKRNPRRAEMNRAIVYTPEVREKRRRAARARWDRAYTGWQG